MRTHNTTETAAAQQLWTLAGEMARTRRQSSTGTEAVQTWADAVHAAAIHIAESTQLLTRFAELSPLQQGAYLRRAAKSTLRDNRRRQQTAANYEGLIRSEIESTTPDGGVNWGELRDHIICNLASDRDRALFTAVYVDGQSIRAAATVLGVSERTAKSVNRSVKSQIDRMRLANLIDAGVVLRLSDCGGCSIRGDWQHQQAAYRRRYTSRAVRVPVADYQEGDPVVPTTPASSLPPDGWYSFRARDPYANMVGIRM